MEPQNQNTNPLSPSGSSPEQTPTPQSSIPNQYQSSSAEISPQPGPQVAAPPIPQKTAETQSAGIISGGIDPLLMPKPTKPKKKLLYILAPIMLLALVGAGTFLTISVLTPNYKSEEPTSTPSAATAPSSANEKTSESAQPIKTNGYASKDEERKGELFALMEALNYYHSTNGQYPTLANMNDPGFRAANFPNLTEDDFKDPAGTDSIFVKILSTNTLGKYGYMAGKVNAPCDGNANNCQSVTLMANVDKTISTSTSGTGSTNTAWILSKDGSVHSSVF